ncbi:hypothetical protein [Sphingobium yanoikuyae]|uniref:hypothetical protein n=1 Tax=Sphingobium yanoikuyae TaxID=13690 RepID=UPI0035C670BA
MRQHCQDCRFLHRSMMQCHRNPPLIRTSGAGTHGISEWPQVKANDWCGEWKEDENARIARAEADELAKIGPTAEIANLARLVLENGWAAIIKADSHEPEDHRFANRHMLEFMSRNGLFRAVVHATLPMGAIQITPKGMWVRAAVERLEAGRADQA